MAWTATWEEIDTAWEDMGDMTWNGLDTSEWTELTPDDDDAGTWYRIN